VVKGTQFRVTIDAGKTSVDVIRGQVQVADFKTGQIAQVMAGQHATAFANGKAGLTLGGTGTFSPIEQGKPRAPSVQQVPVHRAGLPAPRNGYDRASAQSSRQAGVHSAGHGVTRISSAIGEVRLNVHRATHGLARDNAVAHGRARNAASNKATVWGSSGPGDNQALSNNGQGNGSNNAASASSAATSGVSSTIAAVSGSDGGSNGNNGNHGNGNNGNGNGNVNGNANGNNGNGNGNGANGNGRGHAYGRYK
jgi:hypothetical protein